jgi:STE24 endopeptidase
MSATFFLVLFLVILSLYLVVELGLISLNLRYVRAHTGAVPNFAKRHIDQETFSKACSYTGVRGRFALVSTCYSAVFLLAFLFLGGFGAVDDLLQARQWSVYLCSVAYVLFVSLISDLPPIIFNIMNRNM